MESEFCRQRMFKKGYDQALDPDVLSGCTQDPNPLKNDDPLHELHGSPLRLNAKE
jgi:hypothetical protein